MVEQTENPKVLGWVGGNRWAIVWPDKRRDVITEPRQVTCWDSSTGKHDWRPTIIGQVAGGDLGIRWNCPRCHKDMTTTKMIPARSSR